MRIFVKFLLLSLLLVGFLLFSITNAYADTLRFDQTKTYKDHYVYVYLDSTGASCPQQGPVTITGGTPSSVNLSLISSSSGACTYKSTSITATGSTVGATFGGLSASIPVQATAVTPLTANAITFGSDKWECGAGNDDDGDGLCNNWETTDGLKIFKQGTSPALTISCSLDGCPDPNKRDIYIEIDWMIGHKPSAESISKIKKVFSDNNINAHIQLSEEVGHTDSTPFPGSNWGTGKGFDQIKAKYIETSGASTTVKTAKAHAFYYILFAHTLSGSNPTEDKSKVSGASEINGNDAMITLGSFDGQTGSIDQQEGTLLHEIGHMLNLHHGGDQAINCKPNYVSVMSYAHQLNEIPNLNRKLDFSNDKLPTINENSGSQTIGPYTPQSNILYGSSTGDQYFIGSTGSGITGSDNLNYIKVVECDDPTETLTGQPLDGYDDWGNIDLLNRDSYNYAYGTESDSNENSLNCIMVNDKAIEHMPDFMKNRLCIDNEISSDAVKNIRSAHITNVQHIISDVPADQLVDQPIGQDGMVQMSAGDVIELEMEGIHTDIENGNILEALEKTKKLQQRFDGEGDDELIADDASRKIVYDALQEVIDTQSRAVPEFESIAILVLVVSITSIIVLSQKSRIRLSI